MVKLVGWSYENKKNTFFEVYMSHFEQQGEFATGQAVVKFKVGKKKKKLTNVKNP